MCGKLALVTRLFLMLALVLAAMPASARLTPCAKTPPKAAKPHCAMPCCAAKAAAESMASCCAPQGAKSELGKAGCPCEMTQGPMPARTEGALCPTVPPVAALPTRTAYLPPAFAEGVEPGVFGLDSGPPPDRSAAPDLGRAPPAP